MQTPLRVASGDFVAGFRSLSARFESARIVRGRPPWLYSAVIAGLIVCYSIIDTRAAAPSQPPFRLADAVRPLRYAVELIVRPEQDSFSGQVMIELQVTQPVSNLWLHARNLSCVETYAEAKGTRISTQWQTNGDQNVSLSFEPGLRRGRARLHVTYRGRISDRDQSGLLRCKEGTDWYAVTHLVPTGARCLIPCFDEPRFKVPWQITLHIHRGHRAFSNAAVVSEHEEAGGMKCVQFAETEPLPSYVVAFAVGPFETVDLGRSGRKETPLRIITPRGRTSDAAFARQAIPAWFRLVEDYCGVPFPYAKLDHVAVPKLPVPAMENAGLITCRAPILLAPPARQTAAFQRLCAWVTSHEMVHQWFGDLVTIAWWDERWLKEAFAKLISHKILHQWSPDQFKSPGENFLDSFPIDGRFDPESGLRRPVETEAHILKTFNSDAMNRAAEILLMFEAWLGERRFQEYVRTYLRQFGGRNATAMDFARVMNRSQRQDLAPTFATFLDHPGVPLIKVLIQEERNRPVLVLSPVLYRALGTAAASDPPRNIPILLRYETEGRAKRGRAWLNRANTEFALQALPSTLSWALVNEHAAGFYRVAYPISMLRQVLGDGSPHLSVAERLGLALDVRASVVSGDLQLGDALEILPLLLRDSDPRVVVHAANLLETAGRQIAEPLRDPYQRYVRRIVASALPSARWQTPTAETEDACRVRLTLLELLSNQGEDPVLIDEALRLAKAWLSDRNTLTEEAAPKVIAVAGRFGDRALLDRFVREAKQSTNMTHRWWLYTSLGGCRDPGLLTSLLEALVARQFEPDDASTLLEAAAGQPSNHRMIYEFVKRHFDGVMASLPDTMRSWDLRLTVENFFDLESRTDVERFLRSKDPELTGGTQAISQVLETIELACVFHEFHQRSVELFLSKE